MFKNRNFKEGKYDPLFYFTPAILYIMAMMIGLSACQNEPKSPPNIVIYTKVGCSRCAKAKEILENKPLVFTEKSIGNRDSATEMWQILKKSGHQTGTSVTMPVVLVDSIVYYNIDDIPRFFEGLH
jgi:glutaredoxin